MPEMEPEERWKKIDELNGANAELLDRIEQRQAAWEKGEVKLNAEQEARLKKWNETLDQFFKMLEDMRRKLDRVN